MILTQCPVCAAPLPDLTAKQCSRCKTRYCGPACQKKHWEEGGHANLCKKIKKGGGAEQYHADKKYAETVTVAAEAYAEDTRGQTCYICTEAVHRHTGEGLVRGCACHTTEGFVHISCLAEQAKILCAEAEANYLDHKWAERWSRWHTCSLCEQDYHGVVRCALGWACWKTYLGLSGGDWARRLAMTALGNGLHDADHREDALSVREATLSTYRRLGVSADAILVVQSNLANSYQRLGRLEEALRMRQDVYSGRLEVNGKEQEETLRAANNYASTLNVLKRFEEAKALLRKTIPVARRVLGEGHRLTLKMRKNYAKVLFRDPSATIDDLREAVTTLEDVGRIARRVFGGAHPLTVDIEESLRRAALGTCEDSKIN